MNIDKTVKIEMSLKEFQAIEEAIDCLNRRICDEQREFTMNYYSEGYQLMKKVFTRV
jgi:hypothetical protein